MQTVPVDSKFERNIEIIVIALASLLIIVGCGGLLITITLYGNGSDALQYGIAFVHTYMLIFGIVMMKLRKNLIFKRKI
jgi:hypothetical protein